MKPFIYFHCNQPLSREKKNTHIQRISRAIVICGTHQYLQWHHVAEHQLMTQPPPCSKCCLQTVGGASRYSVGGVCCALILHATRCFQWQKRLIAAGSLRKVKKMKYANGSVLSQAQRRRRPRKTARLLCCDSIRCTSWKWSCSAT